MSERPFMQLYVSDFLGDTLHLSTELVGAYLLLLMAMWNAGGSLPDDEAKLARVARMTVKKWRAVSPDLMSFFDVSEGKVQHHRLTKEFQKSERQSESRASAGAKGGTAKALNNKNRALANGVAKRWHLPEPYRKDGATLNDPTEGLVKLDRYADEFLFKACERVSGTPVPDYQQFKSWPPDVVAKARASA